MASLSTQSAKARFAPADVPLRRSISDWGIRGVSAFGAAACRLLGPRVEGQFGILLYHRIADKVPGVEWPSINVSPRQFERQILGLLQAGFVFWPLRRVRECVARGEGVPPYVVVLTFDDGFECVYHHAWPLLKELNLPATVFLATAYLNGEQPFPFDHWGNKHSQSVPSTSYRPMTLEQCRELAASGLIEFGAHTHTHEDFRGRPQAFRDDLMTNLNVLNELFGLTDVSFAFPYGTPRLGFTDGSLTDMARDAGVHCALTTRGSLVSPDESPFAWGRFTVFPWDNAATLSAKLGGWYGWAPELKNRLLGRTRVAGRASRVESQSLGEDRARMGFTRRTISVVVPTLNRAAWLEEALQSLIRQRTDDKFEFEIVVCDNASTDDTANIVAKVAQSSAIPIRYCYQPQPGDAPARNLALQHAKGEWLAFFDDDQFASENWLSELVIAAELTGGTIIGGPVRLDLSPRQRIEFGGLVCEALRETELYPRLQPYLQRALPGTGNAFVARTVFDTIGNFDESFINGGSDHDFFTRARAAGFASWYAPRAVIRHRLDPRRLTVEYLRRDALASGADHAEHLDYKQFGLSRVLVCGLARAGQAILIHSPLLIAGWLRLDGGQVLGRRIRLWRTAGYLGKSMTLIARRVFPRTRPLPQTSTTSEVRLRLDRPLKEPS